MGARYIAVVHREEKFYVAECLEIGTVSQGESIEEAIENLKEATELYLEEFPLPKVEEPFISVFEVKTRAKISKTVGT